MGKWIYHNAAAKTLKPPPYHKEVLIALKKAARNVVLNHKKTGNPVVIWEDGQIVFKDPWTM